MLAELDAYPLSWQRYETPAPYLRSAPPLPDAADVSARVARGAALLDDLLPGWADEINLAALHMDSQVSCVLGQLYGSYDTGVDTLITQVLLRKPMQSYLRKYIVNPLASVVKPDHTTPLQWSAAHGFAIPTAWLDRFTQTYDMLTCAWWSEIAVRQASTTPTS